MIGYEHEERKYVPFHLEDELRPADLHPRGEGLYDAHEGVSAVSVVGAAADVHLFGRVREPDEMAGIWRQLLLTRASDDTQHRVGQDGGFVSAMLIWSLDNDYIEPAMVSGVDDDAWKARRS